MVRMPLDDALFPQRLDSWEAMRPGGYEVQKYADFHAYKLPGKFPLIYLDRLNGQNRPTPRTGVVKGDAYEVHVSGM